MRKYCPTCDTTVETEHSACARCQTNLVTTGERSLVGTVIDKRYEVVSELGRGGMGVVYLARQQAVDRLVAVKVLKADMAGREDTAKRFLLEAKAMARLTNAHTITLYDFGVTESGQPYFVMERLVGKALNDILSEQGWVSPKRACMILGQACLSLEEAHAKGVLHRDLKPENLFITTDEQGREHVKVLDFGIAKIMDSDEKMTRTGMVCGTPAYLSPEQLQQGPIDGRADVYALGVILFEMLSGQTPFHGNTPAAVIVKHVTEAPPSIRDVAPEAGVNRELAAFIERCLAKKPDDRPPTVTAFAATLGRLVMGDGGLAPDRKSETSPEQKLRAAATTAVHVKTSLEDGEDPELISALPSRGERWAWIVGVPAFLIAAGLLGVILFDPGEVEEPQLGRPTQDASSAAPELVSPPMPAPIQDVLGPEAGDLGAADEEDAAETSGVDAPSASEGAPAPKMPKESRRHVRTTKPAPKPRPVREAPAKKAQPAEGANKKELFEIKRIEAVPAKKPSLFELQPVGK